jgi:uncharacterized protein (DUF2126 family)/transglutaminase-like putative cysteine protease
MAIKVAINHKTTYSYDRLVNLSPHVFRLRPASHSRTAIEAYSFKVSPANHFINWQQDPFGNYQARVVFPEQTKELSIEVEVIANMVVINPFDFFVEEYASKFPFQYQGQLVKELAPYLEVKDDGPMLEEWMKTVSRESIEIVDFLVYINQKVYKDINYSIRMEAGVQTPDETLGLALGSCRDSAWLLVQALRKLGLAARFVSGYLVQLKADVEALDGPSGPPADFTDLHAWAEVYIPGAGWVGLDATSGLFAGEGHIPLACTPDYLSAAPVVGATSKCETTFSFSNVVTRIHEDPRVTKPYSEEEWTAINALGMMVDYEYQKGDVRMTMGGEPTFVSIDDMESAQWNTEADGVEKRILSHELLLRLRARFAPAGMLHYGQGKWYPGEPLPRWQYGLFWRKDGLPMWKNTSLLALENNRKKYTHIDAEAFITELTKALAVPASDISALHEDIFYFLWTEGKIPVNIDPMSFTLKDPIERRTLTQLLDKGLETPAGFVLPLEWSHSKNSWKSGKWRMKREEIFLIPGNSPIGLRLPLDALSKIAAEYEPYEIERSLFETIPYLQNDYTDTVRSRYGSIVEHEDTPARRKINEAVEEEKQHSKHKKNEKEIKEAQPLFYVPLIKTALCVEVRDGILYVFLPPLKYIEHYLDLLTSIELTAEKLQIPVRIEGYEPPRDNRIERLVVSPDPGVIEVNIHPAKDWKEMSYNLEVLYQEAFKTRLGTEKFMLDGKHTGTGGGNHITIGGATPGDSPLLRRPDLLRSIITFWQHHPGLSYLFSGAFIGPTSQAPRFDEGRDEKLYEMEIAFAQIPNHDEIPFWLVDRLFRHLLTDITGNTHRAELCIDKLYSPDSSSGRLGILEFRAFDMPPHKEMSMVQMLLIRTLIAWFWKTPYKKDLVPWGTELHDKYMLPHFVEQDMKDIVRDLNDAGYPFQMSWLAPFFEFRFPHYGTVHIKDVQIQIRMGIEPWHVLGEEMSSSGTSRYVDSSLERLQVKLTNMNDSRYVLACNGFKVPLKPTPVKGEFVCGIRYRAWQPPSALHPTIGIDTPLVFDLIDTWNGRSVGGCTYHIAHPGGRSYDTFPINSYEAESRRVSRFWDNGHTQDPIPAPDYVTSTPIGRYMIEINPGLKQFELTNIETNKAYPNTLDMRLCWKAKNKDR